MKSLYWKGLLLTVCFLALSTPVLADTAPPWTAQGVTIEAGKTPTYVQMVSEEVSLKVEAVEITGERIKEHVEDEMIAHVDATFFMQNQGTESESFDMWFPITWYDKNMRAAGDRYNVLATFQVWVDGVPATVGEGLGHDLLGGSDDVPWATWPATFPPGQTVTVRVTYDIHPTGYSKWGLFHYILETGAGWYGPIGAGTVTVSLPYAVEPGNTVTSFADTHYKFEYLGGQLAPTQISGNEIVWSFKDLEPAAEHNIAVMTLSPWAWADIVSAREAVTAQPESAEAYLALAQAYRNALPPGPSGYHVIENENELWLTNTTDAYRRAAELAPEDTQILTTYLDWLWEFLPDYEKLMPAIAAILPQAQSLAPDHPFVAYYSTKNLPTPEPATPTAQPATPTPEPATPTAPAATPTAAPATPASPVATPAAPTPTATPAAPTGPCAGALFLGLLLFLPYKLRLRLR